ncbi:DUF1707 domain-containing protein [Sphaerisporangium sp. NPDC049002]|uniref:DUF1707 SHOCT-like domain-containing protein n=1 Tax=Sphaerisporangium sp. NPDC049002 TaxID=3155392 RepID=UPI0033CF25B3
MTDHAEIRAGDRDRDNVAETLRVALSEGRISIDELHERLDRTYAARTCGELDVIVADLPQAGDLPATREDASDVLRLHTRGRRNLRQTGYWVVPPLISAKVAWGKVRIDFTQAICHHSEVSVEVECGLGDIVLLVPHGWRVRADEVITRSMGSVHNKPHHPPAPDAVTLRLFGLVRIGDVWVRYRRPRA